MKLILIFYLTFLANGIKGVCTETAVFDQNFHTLCYPQSCMQEGEGDHTTNFYSVC